MVVSSLPSCREIEWSDFHWLSKAWGDLINQCGLKASTYSATNAWLFRERHRYLVFDHHPPFLIEPLEQRVRMIPTRFPLKWDAAFFEHLFGMPCSLFPIATEWLGDFPETDYTIMQSDAESDYIYHTQTLSKLAGRHLSSRRNLLHQLTRQYRMSLKAITNETLQDTKNILNQWQVHYHEQHPSLQADYAPCLEALEKLSLLPLTGQIAYADDQPIGFYLGERLSKTVYIIHFLKEFSAFHGVVPFLYQACALAQASDVEWINLEQDLGIPGLRQAKQAYRPAELLEKWEIKNLTSS